MSNLSENQSSETALNQSQPVNGEKGIVKPRSFIEKIIKTYTVQIAQSLKKYNWITPNRISILSFLLGGVLAAWLIWQKYYFMGVASMTISVIFDGIDGDLARERGVASPKGAILDSVLDRYVDFLIISALILLDPSPNLIPGLLSIFGGMMVPYVRARTEAEGISVVPAVIGNRTTRIMMIIIGVLTQQILLLLIVLAVTSNIAALQRFISALKPEISK